MTQDVSNAVNSSKLKYHEHLALKLNDPKPAPKNLLENTKNNSYWKQHSFNTFIASCKGGSRVAATSKMERFVIIVNG